MASTFGWDNDMTDALTLVFKYEVIKPSRVLLY